MKIVFSLESCLYAVVIVLSLAAMALVVSSTNQFNNTKVVYQGF